MRVQERIGHSSIMSGRMNQDEGMVEMACAHEMMREEVHARTTYPEHRCEE
jgi:hypothetical protein